MVSIAKQEFTASSTTLLGEKVISVLVIVFLTIILGILLARVITKPLDKLAFVAQSVEQGGTFHPENLAEIAEQRDEVGYLARGFSTMVGALNARVAELYTVNRIPEKYHPVLTLPIH